MKTGVFTFILALFFVNSIIWSDTYQKKYLPQNENIVLTIGASNQKNVKITISQKNEQRTILVTNTYVERNVYLYGFSKNEPLDISSSNEIKNISSFELPKFPDALVLSYNEMLERQPNSFRNKNYEIYSWSAIPEVKVFAFTNYTIQTSFFARIAFFTEKNGYRGKILSDVELKGRHDWNAHDYSSESLANFFNALGASKIKPNKDENFLRDFCIKQGIIVLDGSIYKEGKGSLISFSFGESTSSELRTLLLGHEILHGVFFSIPVLQEMTEKEYDALPEQASLFIHDYFAYKTYDLEYRQLMINELMAYLFQQSEKTLLSEIENLWLPRMKSKFPAKTKLYNQSLEKAKEQLKLTRQRMESPIFEKIGLNPPNLFDYQVLKP